MCCRLLQKSSTYAALQPAQAHVTVSLSCVIYLASSLKFVDPSVSERDIREQVIQRFHELLLYACDHWLDHLQALADRPTRLLAEQDTLSSLQKGLESLSHLHTELALSEGWTCGQQTDAMPSSRDDLWSSLEVSPSVCKLLNQGLMSKGQVSAMASVRPGQYSTFVFKVINIFAIRTDLVRSPIIWRPGSYSVYKRSSPLQEHY